MRKLITMLVVFAACLSTTAAVQAGEKDSKVNGWSGHRTIIPYRAPLYPPAAPTPIPNFDGFHFLPHIYIGPNDRGGFGTNLGLRFGRFKSYGFRLGVDFF
jgi:hypothetical protein